MEQGWSPDWVTAPYPAPRQGQGRSAPCAAASEAALNSLSPGEPQGHGKSSSPSSRKPPVPNHFSPHQERQAGLLSSASPRLMPAREEGFLARPANQTQVTKQSSNSLLTTISKSTDKTVKRWGLWRTKPTYCILAQQGPKHSCTPRTALP